MYDVPAVWIAFLPRHDKKSSTGIHLLRAFPRDLPAFDNAIATACFCGLPAAISVSILVDTVLRLLPVFRGIGGPRVNHGLCSVRYVFWLRRGERLEAFCLNADGAGWTHYGFSLAVGTKISRLVVQWMWVLVRPVLHRPRVFSRAAV